MYYKLLFSLDFGLVSKNWLIYLRTNIVYLWYNKRK